MKKISFFALALILLPLSNLNARTIWIQDNTNNHSSMTTFYNTLIEDLKLTQYKQYIKIVSDNKQIKEQFGDILIEINGLGLSSNTGNITYVYFVGCIMDQCNNWVYIRTAGRIFSDNHIYESSREIRIAIVNFLDEWFK